jgi:hypothetical protein
MPSDKYRGKRASSLPTQTGHVAARSFYGFLRASMGVPLFANYVTWPKSRNDISRHLSRKTNENIYKFMTKLGGEDKQSKAIPSETYVL